MAVLAGKPLTGMPGRGRRGATVPCAHQPARLVSLPASAVRCIALALSYLSSVLPASGRLIASCSFGSFLTAVEECAHRGLQLTQLVRLLVLQHALRVPCAAVPQKCCLLQEVVVRDELSVTEGCNRDILRPFPLASAPCAQSKLDGCRLYRLWALPGFITKPCPQTWVLCEAQRAASACDQQRGQRERVLASVLAA